MDKSQLDPNTTPSMAALKAQVSQRHEEVKEAFKHDLFVEFSIPTFARDADTDTNRLIDHIADLHAKLILIDVVGAGMALFEEETI